MRIVLKLAALAVMAGLVMPASLASADNILFIGNDGTTPGVFNAADTAMIARLSGALGHTVTALDDRVATPADGVGKGLIIISSTVGSGPVKDQWNSSGVVASGGDGAIMRNWPCPVLNFENGLSDELGYMNAAAGQGIYPNAGSSYPAVGLDINILMPAHPLAAGLAGGFQPVLAAPGSLTSHGNSLFGGGMPASADIVAKFTSVPTGFGAGLDAAHTAIMALELGDAFGTAVADPDYLAIAPTRRVGFMMDDTNFLILNANGLALFDAAVAYGLAGPCVPEPSTLALSALGLLGLVVQQFVRRKK